jgi:hypothetical protein
MPNEALTCLDIGGSNRAITARFPRLHSRTSEALRRSLPGFQEKTSSSAIARCAMAAMDGVSDQSRTP